MHVTSSRTPVRTAAALAALAALATLGLAGTAEANRPAGEGGGSVATGVVRVNPGYTLSVHSGPRAAARVTRRLRNGTRVRIVCQTSGDRMTGRFGTSGVWDKLAKGGYVTDTYVQTGSDGRVAPACPKPSGGGGGGGGRPASVVGRDDYPFASASWNDVDPWRFYKRECTSFVAYRLNKVMSFSNFMDGGHFGNAMGWDENARRLGFRVNRRPTVGSVMVRNSGTYGHVAMVAKVRPGRVFVEQYNAGGTHVYSKQWLSVASYMTFIHFNKRS
jgi:surface antigen